MRRQQRKFCRRLRAGRGVDWGLPDDARLRRRDKAMLAEAEMIMEAMMKEEGADRWTASEALRRRRMLRRCRVRSGGHHAGDNKVV